MQLDDLTRLSTVLHPSMLPDGRVVFATSRPNLTDDRYDGHLWLWSDADGARRLTNGPTDVQPVVSPEGDRVSFLRKGSAQHDRPQLAVLDLRGGEPRVLTDFTRGVVSHGWLPDGTGLVISAASLDPAREAMTPEERERAPRRMTSHPYRFDTIGWTHDRQLRLWAVDAVSGDRRRLTDGEYDEEFPVVSPDGSKVAFLSDRTGRVVHDLTTQIWELDLADGSLTMRADLGLWTRLGYRPDGALHVQGLETGPDWPDMVGWWRLDPTGPVNLIRQLDRGMAYVIDPVAWRGDHAVILVEDAGRVTICEVDPDGLVRHLHERDAVVTGVAAGGDRTAFTCTSYADPGELWIADGDEPARPVTAINESFRQGVGGAVGEHFTVPSDGYDIDAWVYVPPGTEPAPVLLNIHGGPAAQYGYGFFDEFQLYVAAGYAVVCCNPRGSSGRGSDHVKAVTGDGWGVNDLADVLAVVDAALDHHPRLDGKRMGVMGGSYGGFMTAWITAHDRRFSSAVVERALLSWVSFAGTSDIGTEFPAMYTGARLPDGFVDLWKKSPLSVAHQTTTPTLILHSDQDHRCPIEQAEQYFTALLVAGTEAELLRFPGESHELSRSGKPRHRRERFEAILDWHGRHLFDGGENLAN